MSRNPGAENSVVGRKRGESRDKANFSSKEREIGFYRGKVIYIYILSEKSRASIDNSTLSFKIENYILKTPDKSSDCFGITFY